MQVHMNFRFSISLLLFFFFSFSFPRWFLSQYFFFFFEDKTIEFLLHKTKNYIKKIGGWRHVSSTIDIHTQKQSHLWGLTGIVKGKKVKWRQYKIEAWLKCWSEFPTVSDILSAMLRLHQQWPSVVVAHSKNRICFLHSIGPKPW